MAVTAALGWTAVGMPGWASEDTAGKKVPPTATTTAYQLSPGMIKNTSKGNPTQVHGVLGMPKGAGPHPVVMVLHGSHPTCAWPGGRTDRVARNAVSAHWPLVCGKPGEKYDPMKPGPDYLRNDAGLSYIVQALTRKGFVAASIDVRSAEAWFTGEPSPAKGYTELIDTHLKLLADLNKGISHGLAIKGAKGRIDTSRVGLVGHSRGGGYVLNSIGGKRPGLFATVAIEPAEEVSKAPHTVPVLNIRGACDEDTGPAAGLDTIKALAKSGRTSVAADVRLAGAGHAMLNTNLIPLEKNGGIGDCPAAKVADPAAARDQVAQLTASFMSQALRKAKTYTLPALAGPTPSGKNLNKNGPALRFTAAGRLSYTDPRRIPATVSKEQRLLPPVPKGLKVVKGGEPDL
ncbi:dienelactone hydrolase family protein [Streptomyces sp. NEAU-Y11]|uniref:dienelactone hydrolase family protein n=1 Tax=Streptomyces cucumeris TaxID=2962890 RepID=UPI0020C89800|nr:S9 family peptidase [Streptomyces sp. NEAU-Y11]MCP9212030.1 S9 family peptidase [Streptomyces sp. NEAU-Y11]